MNENELSNIIIGAALTVHRDLGPGLLESVYEECFDFELNERDIKFERQKYIPVVYKNIKLEGAFRADFIIENKIIVELKAVESIANTHKSQLLTYLKLTDLKLGLLINFNNSLLKDGIHRVVNKL
ncbi:MAG: GxxExxY protein [bacterium]|jgi:GxxExxY protein